jgi:hypothetical protein
MIAATNGGVVTPAVVVPPRRAMVTRTVARMTGPPKMGMVEDRKKRGDADPREIRGVGVAEIRVLVVVVRPRVIGHAVVGRGRLPARRRRHRGPAVGGRDVDHGEAIVGALPRDGDAEYHVGLLEIRGEQLAGADVALAHQKLDEPDLDLGQIGGGQRSVVIGGHDRIGVKIFRRFGAAQRRNTARDQKREHASEENSSCRQNGLHGWGGLEWSE